jgi:hypothetical protein
MPSHIATEPLPRETAPLAAVIKAAKGYAMHRALKAVQRATVVGHAKIIEVPAHLARQPLPEVRQRTRIRGRIAPRGAARAQDPSSTLSIPGGSKMAVFMGFLRSLDFMVGPGQPGDILKTSGAIDFSGFLQIQFI